MQTPTPEILTQRALKFVGDFSAEEADFWDASPIRLENHWRTDARLLLSWLFTPAEFVCINVNYRLDKANNNKVTIIGAGQTKSVQVWLKESLFASPQSDAGTWIRIDPVSVQGTGKGGAHQDSDVTALRYLLMEMDKIPLPLQLSMAGKLPLPIAALVLSGGKSLHVWLAINARDRNEYAQIAELILSKAALIGVDSANKNPSRYCRLPGAQRKIGASGDGAQKLLYLNPHPEAREIFP